MPQKKIVSLDPTHQSEHQELIMVNLGIFKGRPLTGILFCPFPSKENPAVKAIKEAVDEFPLKHNLMKPTDLSYKKFVKARFDLLGAYVQPDDTPKDAILGALNIAWLFCHDDKREESEFTPKQIVTMNLEFEKILEGKKQPKELETELEKSLYTSIFLPLQEKGADLGYFISGNQQYFQANKWEARNRTRGVVPNHVDYIAFRQHTSAVLACLAMALLTGGEGNLSEKVNHNVYLKRLVEHAIAIICLINDIYSVRKEIQERVMENAILVKLFESLTKKNPDLRQLFYPTSKSTTLDPYQERIGLRKAIISNLFDLLEGKPIAPVIEKLSAEETVMYHKFIDFLTSVDLGEELQTALTDTIDMHNSEMKSFISEKNGLLELEDDQKVKGYVTRQEYWIGGHMKWTPESPRYIKFS